MKYKVIPFTPALDRKNPLSEGAAIQLTTTINKHSEDNWEYVRVETLNAWVAPKAGCFGLGGMPGYNTSAQMIVFKKKEA